MNCLRFLSTFGPSMTYSKLKVKTRSMLGSLSIYCTFSTARESGLIIVKLELVEWPLLIRKSEPS